MAEDVSNKTVLVLVILTILISTLGTFTVTSSVSQYRSQVPVYEDSSSNTGRVSLSIGNSNVQDVQTVSSPATGNVIFNPVPSNS